MVFFEVNDLPPILLNSRMHWRTQLKQKKQWYEWVRLLTLDQVPEKPWDRAFARYSRFSGSREPDEENLHSAFKWVQDGIVNAGIIVDDSPSVLEREVRWFPAPPGRGKILVTVVPILHPGTTVEPPPQ